MSLIPQESRLFVAGEPIALRLFVTMTSWTPRCSIIVNRKTQWRRTLSVALLEISALSAETTAAAATVMMAPVSHQVDERNTFGYRRFAR